MNVLKNLKVGALLLMALLPMAVGCGDAHRNDQGVSFTNFGWFDEDKTPIGYMRGCQSTLSEAIVGADHASIVGWIGLQNNLSGEYIRVQRVHHSYHVYGAKIQPPDTSSATTGILLPASQVGEGEFGGSTLPDSFSNNTDTEGGMAQILYLPTPLITSDVASFMSLNRAQMPEPPFTMVVESYAEGVTSSGRRMYSNTGYMEIQVVDDVTCLSAQNADGVVEDPTNEGDEVVE